MGNPSISTPGMKPPEPSASKHPAGDLTAQIACEFRTVLERLGADADLRAIVGRWGNTLSDAEMLTMLREFNATGKVAHQPR
jgi:hypothetical protein